MRDMDEMMEAIAAMAGEKPKPPALIAVALRDQAAFYTRENPFNVGDLVTPRKGGFVKGSGDACIVVGVREHAEPNFGAGDPGNPDFGLTADVRVLRQKDGRYFAIWTESSQYEPWIDPAELAPGATIALPEGQAVGQAEAA